MITKKEYLLQRIEDCQKGIWWNEIVLKRQIAEEKPKDKIDATKHAIESDTETIKVLQQEIDEIGN